MSAAEDPVRVLLENGDPIPRSRAHYKLGKRAWAENHVGRAQRHFQEAADLDPTDERPLLELARIEEHAAEFEVKLPRAGFLRRVLSRFSS